jgi:ribose transport system substrate-binding protein
MALKKLAAALIAGGLILSLAGCNRGGETGTPAGESSGSARVALVTRNLTNAYWVAWNEGAEAQFKKRGVKGTVAVGESETDIQGMSNNLATLANQSWDCIGVVPINDSNVITPLVTAAQRGIKIIDIDAQIDPDAAKAAGLDITTYIGSDNKKAGTLAAEKMLELTGGSGEVAMLLGTPGEHNSTLRQEGFRAGVDGKLEIVQEVSANFERAQAQTAVEAMLKVHPDLRGIFAANDEMGLGALRAIQTAGRQDEIKVISVDGIQEALESVRDGGLAGTVIQYPYVMSGMAVDACIALKNGFTLPEYVPAPISLISSDNAQKQIDAYPLPLEEPANPFADMLTSKKK